MPHSPVTAVFFWLAWECKKNDRPLLFQYALRFHIMKPKCNHCFDVKIIRQVTKVNDDAAVQPTTQRYRS